MKTKRAKQSSWYLSSIEIRGAGDRTAEVWAYLSDDVPGLAVTQTGRERKYWTITHASSSLRIGATSKKAKLVQQTAERISSMVDWTLSGEELTRMTKTELLKVREVVRGPQFDMSYEANVWPGDGLGCERVPDSQMKSSTVNPLTYEQITRISKAEQVALDARPLTIVPPSDDVLACAEALGGNADFIKVIARWQEKHYSVAAGFESRECIRSAMLDAALTEYAMVGAVAPDRARIYGAASPEYQERERLQLRAVIAWYGGNIATLDVGCAA